MRPATKYALYCPDEHQRSVVNFLLSTRLRSKVICCDSGAELLATLSRHDFASDYNEIRTVIVIHSGNVIDTRRILYRLAMRFPDAPVVLIDKLGLFPETLATTVRIRGEINNAEFIDTLKTISARKRGPKQMQEHEARTA